MEQQLAGAASKARIDDWGIIIQHLGHAALDSLDVSMWGSSEALTGANASRGRFPAAKSEHFGASSRSARKAPFSLSSTWKRG